MIIFKKARSPKQTLNDLDSYLQSVGTEPIKLLARQVQSWGEISYDELADLIADGRLDDYLDWQGRYSALIAGTLAPLWSDAITAASRKATAGKVVLYDSNDYVRAWIENRGGELITQLSRESQKAVAMVILLGQSNRMTPRDIAKQVRPLIGLNERQAAANLNYREKVYNKYREQGMGEVKARERADKAAIKYAGKQHRFRAETIVHTELAFAYNRGAHMGVSQGIADGLMGRCAMKWSTAGTNRVCSRCLALKDTIVGYTDESGVTIPPLHPRCRCAIIYDEVAAPRRVDNKPKPQRNATETHGGVECQISYSKESVQQGRINFSAKVFTTPDGTQFFFHKKPDAAKQTMTPNEAIEAWYQIPKKIREMAQKKIYFVEVENPDDDYWRRHYKYFTSSYATGGEEIIFYRYTVKHNLDYVKRTYCHEAGHFIDRTLGAGTGKAFSNSAAWVDAIYADMDKTGMKSVTAYGENSPVEDFAESVALYVKDAKAFRRKFKNRAKVLKEKLGKI